MNKHILTAISALSLALAFTVLFFVVTLGQGQEEGEVVEMEVGDSNLTVDSDLLVDIGDHGIVSMTASLLIQLDEDYTIENAVDDLFNPIIFDSYFDPSVGMAVRKASSREIVIESPCGKSYTFTKETFPRKSLECSCEDDIRRPRCYVVLIEMFE